jgi:hypothetical protein
MNDNHDGIQAEKPIPPNDNRNGIQTEKLIPPWEQPGFFQLNREPHRGTLLYWLALPSAFLCCLNIAVQMGYFGYVLHIHYAIWSAFRDRVYLNICANALTFSLLGIPFNLAVWLIARHDFAMMRTGLMDPAGEEQTGRARFIGLGGLLVCGFLIAYCGTVLLAMR